MLVPWKANKGISDDLRHFFYHFMAQRGPQGPHQGPPLLPMDNLVCHERSSLLWDDFFTGKLDVMNF